MTTDDRYPDGFLDYFSGVFKNKSTLGKIIKSLQIPNDPILICEKRNEKLVKSLWQKAKLPVNVLPWYPTALIWPKGITPRTKLPGFKERYLYAMNPSSLLPVIALDIQPNDKILDACAAPGGKSLVIYNYLGPNGVLFANDIAGLRRVRMAQLFKAYGKSDIRVLAADARKIYLDYPNYFDKILVDAPCSSEKHLFDPGNKTAQWSITQIGLNQKRQIAIVLGLVKALRVGGTVVYSTCALSPAENEEVVDSVLQTLPNLKLEKVIFKDIPAIPGIGGDKYCYDISYVRRLLPDSMYDPMFIAQFTKIK